MNPYIFIVGCPRSGTTLLQRIVDAHPKIAVVNETHWIFDVWKNRRGLTQDRRVTPELTVYLLEFTPFARMQIDREALEGLVRSCEGARYARFVTQLFDLYGRARQKPLAGDKTPTYALRLRTLHRLWPTVRFIHLIRDGRDTVLSLLDWPTAERVLGRHPTWVEDRVATAAFFWEHHVRMARDDGQPMGSDLYYEIRYEALVAQPEAECAKLCAFLDLPYDSVMLRFHEGRARTDPGLDAKTGWWPVTPDLRDWRRDMASEEVERFEAAVGDLLDELGYPRVVAVPGSAALRNAARLRADFVADLQARGSHIPQYWQQTTSLVGETKAETGMKDI